jgi:YHS domain-containing protein
MPAVATHPDYIVTRTEAGADVNYQCPCGCYAGFALDRSVAEQTPESCCCGRTILVGRDATKRLLAFLPDAEVALATPPDATHGAHEDSPLVHHDAASSSGGVGMQMFAMAAPAGTVHDPVCHMDINPATAAGTSTYEGTTYYFCSRGCKVDFDEEPAGTLAAEAAHDHSRPHSM